MNAFVERHSDNISAVLSCFDRVVTTGTLPEIGYADAMARYLGSQGIRLFDYPRWAEPLREQLRENAEQVAARAGLAIEFIRRHDAFRKEARIKAIIAERGEHPGLVHIFSAMETCPTFKPWHDKVSHHNLLKPSQGKCLHYYFYFIDELFGLAYVRVPTWAPFRLQIYFNGHDWLARRLDRAGVTYEKADNAFIRISDSARAQQIAKQFNPKQLHRRLERWARQFCPVVAQFQAGYHFSLMQVEFSTDVLFHRQDEFQPLYEAIVRSAIHTVKPDQVASFLGRRLTGAFNGELGNDFHTRIQGTRIRHHMGSASIKLYDKAGIMARVECTTNDVTFFKHHRWVEQRDGGRVFKLAPLRKSIYSLTDLARLMRAANERYLEFIGAIDNPDAGLKAIDKVASPCKDKGRPYRGFNLLTEEDHRLFLTLARGEWTISGFRASDLRTHLPSLTPGRTSYLLKRLRTHGLIKKIGRRYKYYLTKLGRRVVATLLSVREFVLIPSLATNNG